MKVPVANPYITEEDAKAVYDVVKSGWLSMGDKVAEFENKFKKYVSVKNAIAVNNGTAALHTTLAALGIGSGDEVILPSLSFVSSANVILYQGAKPVFVDCDPRTFNILPEKIDKHVTDRTKAIIPVDMNGMPFDYDAVIEVAKKHSLPIVADSAESLGAVYKKRRVGSITLVHCFSFFPNKNLTTGEGGMITTNDSELAEKLRRIRHQGQDERYHHVILGYNYRMTEMQAALGIVQLKRLDWVLDKKNKTAEKYTKAFKDSKNIIPPFIPSYVGRHAWCMYTVLIENKNRDEIRNRLEKKGIETRISFPPIHKQPIYADDYGNLSLPNTNAISGKLLSLPNWVGVGEKQNYVIESLTDLCEK